MSKEAEKLLIQWEPISERLITARFQTRFVKVIIIQYYAPTNDHNDENKDKFYKKLQNLINKTPSHDLLLVMGDWKDWKWQYRCRENHRHPWHWAA